MDLEPKNLIAEPMLLIYTASSAYVSVYTGKVHYHILLFALIILHSFSF
jgi:hypothetical protein